MHFSLLVSHDNFDTTRHCSQRPQSGVRRATGMDFISPPPFHQNRACRRFPVAPRLTAAGTIPRVRAPAVWEERHDPSSSRT